MAKSKVNATPFWRFAFLVYCAVMIWLLFFRSDSRNLGLPYKELLRQNTNLVPFYTTKNYLHVLKYSTDRYMRTHCFMNLSGNIVLFIPAGWLLPRLWGWLQNFFRFFAFCAGLIFLVETVQLFTLLGRFDIDDLILNLSGMILGFILFHLGQPR